ncbi:MAG: hypothetical protein AAFY72_03920 [Cyanobacteria bacterium J06649_4]
MQNTYLKIFISVVALILVAVRFFKPDIEIDASILIFLGIAVLPWLSSLVKSVELPGGFKVEFQENKSASQPLKSSALQKDETTTASQSIQPERMPVYSDIPVDSYFERLIKLSPIETIMAFVVVDNLIKSSALGSSVVLWVVFILLTVLTPLFLRRQGARSTQQLLLSTMVFVVWVFALGGPFAYLSWYQPLYGSLALLAATTSSALIINH